MDKFSAVKQLLEDEVIALNKIDKRDELLQHLCETSKTLDAQFVTDLESTTGKNQELNELLKSVLKSTMNLTNMVKLKLEKVNEDDQRKLSAFKGDDNDIEEKIELERAKLSERHLKDNEVFLEVFKGIEHINEIIKNILEDAATTTAYVRQCEDNLRQKEKKLAEIKLKQVQEEETRQEAIRNEQEEAKEAAREEEIKRKEMERMRLELEAKESGNDDDKTNKFNFLRLELPNGEFGANSVGCYVRTMRDCCITAEELNIQLINPLDIECDFDSSEEIISNIILIEPTRSEDSAHFQFEQAFSVVMPHNLGRVQSREACIYRYDGSFWQSVPSQDTAGAVEDDKAVWPGGAAPRMAEAVFADLPLTLTVVSVPRVEIVEYGKRGCNWSATADARVSLLLPPSAVKVSLELQLTTLTFDSTFVQDLRAKTKGTILDNVYSFTHLIKIQSSRRRLLKPATLSLPLPQKTVTKVESSSLPGLSMNTDSKSPKINIGTLNLDTEESVKVFVLDSNKKWIENEDTEIEIDKKDSIKFEFNEVKNLTLIGLRLKPDCGGPDSVNRALQMLTEHLRLRQVRVVLAHLQSDPSQVVLTMCPGARLDRQLRQLHDEGYVVSGQDGSEHDDDGTNAAAEIEIREREKLSLRFRGNVCVAGETEEYVHSFIYCSQLKNKIKLSFAVVDQYAQRAKTKYQGFLTLTLSKWTKKPKPRVEGENRKGPPPMIDVEEIVTLYETILEIPKNDIKSENLNILSSIGNTEFHFTSRDKITEEFIKLICPKLKKEWKRLAKSLNLPQHRIEEIIELSKDCKNTTSLVYQVFKLWIMHLPYSKNKEKILRRALLKINRAELAEEMLGSS